MSTTDLLIAGGLRGMTMRLEHVLGALAAISGLLYLLCMVLSSMYKHIKRQLDSIRLEIGAQDTRLRGVETYCSALHKLAELHCGQIQELQRGKGRHD